MKPFLLDGRSLTVEVLDEIALQLRPVGIDAKARARIKLARSLVEKWVAENEKVYGVTTGFGEFSSIRIGPDDIERLQKNLILSHAAGAGDPLPPEVVRAMMVLRINALAKGHSGVRTDIVDLLASMLNKNIVPVIPSQGSVGSSGDLVQLSHLVLSMIGKGTVWNNRWMGHRKASSAFRQHRVKPIVLKAKEGLALVNGTQMMTAYAGLGVKQARDLARMADIAGSLSLEALRGSDTPFDKRIHRLRPYEGQLAAAANIRRLMKGSEIRESHRFNDPRVQDAYSLRCIPQVHGASRDAIDYAGKVTSIEMNSANDNPLIFPGDGAHLEGGNFHGQPIALAMDFLAIALSELANISERRIERLVNGALSGLPKFLTKNGGLNSGLMIAQYTAASIVSENKVLCHPASVDSIPTSANQEDHNSMGSISAQKAWRVLRNAQTVIAIELMCAAQGLDFVKKKEGVPSMSAGRGVEAAYQHIRSHIRHLESDRYLYPDIQTALQLVRSNSVLASVERAVGSLN